MAGLGAEDSAADVGEGGDTAATVGAELAIVLWAGLAGGDFLDIAAVPDPVAAKLGEAGVDVDRDVGVGVGAARIIEVERGLAARGFEVNGAHRDLDVGVGRGGRIDLAAAADRAGGDRGSGNAGINVGHGLLQIGKEWRCDRHPLPTPG